MQKPDRPSREKIRVSFDVTKRQLQTRIPAIYNKPKFYDDLLVTISCYRGAETDLSKGKNTSLRATPALSVS